ncbi:MAG: hypothetical protein R3E12_08830 [Candidatus Eisenbacteria bacterium]|uniref:Uncharacterized protein n=1 Tax=Eiseniibacteriota bacterium TaxID=2212470 RepID=A0A956LWC8_UNCEI|nr:hypothetical protein [Candidatus Eisenbacteria bacterium]
MHRVNARGRGWRWLVLAALCISGAVGCGREEPNPLPAREERAADKHPPSAGRFVDLRPRAGDVLVPPRIGFRWRYLAGADSVGELGSEGSNPSAEDHGPAPAFRLQVVDSLNVPYVRTETRDSDIRVTLPPGTPPGIYAWWVECVAPDDTTVLAASDRETFRIE